MIQLSKEEAKDLLWESDIEGYTHESTEPWDDNGKYQYALVVFKKNGDDAFYGFSVQRSGSYFSDYYYNIDDESPEVFEVVRKEIITHEWVAK